MMNVTRRLLLPGAALALGCALASASAQSNQSTHPALDRQLERFDLGISAAGQFTSNSSGTGESGQPVSLKPSSTVGYLIAIRYTKSPFVGAEFNYNRVRISNDFLYTNVGVAGLTTQPLDVQTNATEYTLGYVVHTRVPYFGVQPFASVGAGSVAFRPTAGGGQSFSPQARAAYYYNLGAESLVYGSHLGLRVSFRQVFSNAPDFQTTYLRDRQRQISSEPTIGIVLHY